MAHLRIPFCSPYKLIWPLFTRDAAPSSVIHKGYARYVWQMHGVKVVPKMLFYSVFWPVPFAYLCWKHTSRLGRRVQRATGKSPWRQVWEQISVALRYSISPRKYYVFELFRPERLCNARHYLARYQLKGGLHSLLESRIETPSRRILNDKDSFFRHCAAHGIATMPTYLVIGTDGAAERLLPFGGQLPQTDLFVKPVRGRGGRGCERWHWQGNGSYGDRHGQVRSAGDLLAHFISIAASRPILVQEAMRAHEELRDLSVNVLTSCRIMTIKNETGGFEVTHAVFKSSTKPGAIVDNFHKGGVVSRVDLATGELGPASDAGVGEPCVWYETHPLTKARIMGRRLPMWAETLHLVRCAHAAFPDRIIIGWDVAITERGPAIIEGNVQSGCDMIQRTHDLPAGMGRLAECYAYHIRRAFEAEESSDWKARRERARQRARLRLLGARQARVADPT